MQVRSILSLEDHLAWYDYYVANARGLVWLRIPIVGPWMAGRRRQRFVQMILIPENRTALGERTIELSDNGIREFSTGFDFSTKWEDIAHVAITEQHLFLAHPSMNAHIVPLRCFDSDTHRESFLAFVMESKPKTTQGA